MTKLQTALGFSPEQVSALPPPLVKIRELEQDNVRLQKENEDLRRMLSDNGTRGLPMEMTRRNSASTFHDSGRVCDRDFKRRKMSGDEIYMASRVVKLSTHPNSFTHRALVTPHHTPTILSPAPLPSQFPSQYHITTGTLPTPRTMAGSRDLPNFLISTLQHSRCPTLHQARVRRPVPHSRCVHSLLVFLPFMAASITSVGS